jgi:hypothetical protein
MAFMMLFSCQNDQTELVNQQLTQLLAVVVHLKKYFAQLAADPT